MEHKDNNIKFDFYQMFVLKDVFPIEQPALTVSCTFFFKELLWWVVSLRIKFSVHTLQ